MINGYFHKKYESVYNEFKKSFEIGSELGASFSVYKKGQPLIDLYGGYRNKKKTLKWNKNTIVNVHSTGKGLVAMCISILIDRGLLELNEKVSKYWPEFKSNNKENILIRDLLSHQAGLYGWVKSMKEEDLYDWDYCTKLLARQKPFHKLREETCYHAKTIGFLSGELVRKITGKSLGQYLKDEIVGEENLLAFIGTPVEYHQLISEITIYEDTLRKKVYKNKSDKYVSLAFNNPPSSIKTYQTKQWKTSEIPSLNCYSNANSLARIYDTFVNTNNNSNSLISNKTLIEVTKIESDRMDYIMRLPIKWSPVGFIIDGGDLFGTNKNSFGHTGSGGSVAFGDPDLGIGVAYTMNSFSNSLVGDKRARNLIKALYECI